MALPSAPPLQSGPAGPLLDLPAQLQRLAAAACPGGLESALPGLTLTTAAAHQLERALIVGSGSAGNAALLGRQCLERLADLPTTVEAASDFMDRGATVPAGTLIVWALDASHRAEMRSQAGGNPAVHSWAADPAVAMNGQPRPGDPCRFALLALTLYLLACRLGQLRGVSNHRVMEALAPVQQLPELVDHTLAIDGACERLARRLRGCQSLLLLGRGPSYAAAREGAQQLKQHTRLHAEAYPAAELKHGPIALVREGFPVIAVAPRDGVWAKMLATVTEVRTRGGWLLAIGNEGDDDLRGAADELLTVPAAPPLLSPLLTSVPLQLLTLHLAARERELRDGSGGVGPANSPARKDGDP